MHVIQPDGYLLIKVGDRFRPLSAISSAEITHNEPPVTEPEQSIDLNAPAGASSVGSPTPGSLTGELSPPDVGSPAAQAVQSAFWNRTEVEFEAYLGQYRAAATSTSGANAVTVALSTTGILTLATKGTGSDTISSTFGTSESNPGPLWDQAQILEVGTRAYRVGEFLTSATRRVDDLGVIDSDEVAVPSTPTQSVATAVPASDAWTLHEPMLHISGRGRPTVGGDLSWGTDGLSATFTIQLSARETRAYRLAAFKLS